MIVIPAIDLRGGNCVRLLQGRFEDETVFSLDPVSVAREWERRGASLIHVVDLDGAREGRMVNLEAVKAVARGVGVPIQLGGGIRTLEAMETVFDAGVTRIVLGSAAVKSLVLVTEACRRFKERVLAAIDAVDGLVAIEGWRVATQKTAFELAVELKEAGIREIVYTDIRRDGMLGGPNFDGIREMARTGLKVIASGGVSSLDDLRRLRALEGEGVVGVIVGKALYAGKVDLVDAINVICGDGSGPVHAG